MPHSPLLGSLEQSLTHTHGHGIGTAPLDKQALKGRVEKGRAWVLQRGQATSGASLEPSEKRKNRKTKKKKKKSPEGVAASGLRRDGPIGRTSYRKRTKCTPKRPSQISYNTRRRRASDGVCLWTFRVSDSLTELG